MRLVQPLLVLLAFGALCAPANAGIFTLGSDLSAVANVIEQFQQDSAFWNTNVNQLDAGMPFDGQIIEIRLKGIAVQPPGAPAPLNEVHFQTLTPVAAARSDHGDRVQAYLASQAYQLPYSGDPQQINTFHPENLCVKQGGFVAFNDEGGWDGTDAGPYHNGAGFRVFSSVSTSIMDRFTKHAGTYNGSIFDPIVEQGRELLMQVKLATGDDRSQSCGGPARHPDGSLVEPKVHQLRVAGDGTQRPYVSHNRRFGVGVYCESPDEGCQGTAEILRGGKSLQLITGVAVPAQHSGRIGFRLSRGLFKKLKKNHSLLVDLVLTSQFGTTTTQLDLKR
jgi:hypothetical protein